MFFTREKRTTMPIPDGEEEEEEGATKAPPKPPPTMMALAKAL